MVQPKSEIIEILREIELASAYSLWETELCWCTFTNHIAVGRAHQLLEENKQ